MNAAGHARNGWIAVAVIIGIWTGFILLTRHSGTGTLTSWDIATLRFGGAWTRSFSAADNLPPLKVVALFSFFGGIGYAITVYAAFRISHVAGRSCFRSSARYPAFCDCGYRMAMVWSETPAGLPRCTCCRLCRHPADRCRFLFTQLPYPYANNRRSSFFMRLIIMGRVYAAARPLLSVRSPQP